MTYGHYLLLILSRITRVKTYEPDACQTGAPGFAFVFFLNELDLSGVLVREIPWPFDWCFRGNSPRVDDVKSFDQMIGRTSFCFAMSFRPGKA